MADDKDVTPLTRQSSRQVGPVVFIAFFILASCTAVPAPTSAPPVAITSAPPPPAPACAPAISTPRVAQATLADMPHPVGPLVVFGMNGSFLATAYGYPLGAPRHWWEEDSLGKRVREFEWKWEMGLLQSPDGRQVLYGGVDASSGERGLLVRGLAAGSERFLIQSDRPALRWLDNDTVLVADTQGVVRAVDTRTAATRVVFQPAAPPTPKAAEEFDDFDLSGDLRWAVFSRWSKDGSLLRQDLFDVQRQAYVGAGRPLPSSSLSLSPIGDVAVWLDGDQVRAMHLCDRQPVTFGRATGVTASARNVQWSPDGRYFSVSFGEAYEDHGPQRLVVADLVTNSVAQVEAPWGYIQRWSPDLKYVLLFRGGYHTPNVRLASFELR